jgi:putative FmdB family regulatory protein
MTYEYICTACAHAWEAEQPISAAPLKACPSCGAEAAKRQVSGGAGFILRGGGWYADLYGSAKPSKKEESSGDSKKEESSKKDDSKSASTSESKPSTTSETKTTTSEAKPQASTPAVKPAATGS